MVVFRLYTIKKNVSKVYIHVPSLIPTSIVAKNMKQAHAKTSYKNVKHEQKTNHMKQILIMNKCQFELVMISKTHKQKCHVQF
jgi:PleD family two-component response regulator